MGTEHLFASHYSDGKLDLKSARREYDTFLNSDVPRNHMKLLKQYSYGAKYLETDNENITMGYASNIDAFVFNPTNPQLKNYDLNMSLTHEIAHRIDNKMFKSDKRQAFTEAILKYEDTLDRKSVAEIINNSDTLSQNAPLQDIMSAVTGGHIPLAAGHESDYWNRQGKKQREIFANMFTLECFNDTEALGFVKETLPDIYNTYISMTAKKLGRDIDGITGN